AARLDDAVQVLVEDRQVLRLAAGEGTDQRGGEGAGGQGAFAEEVAVQDGVLQHTDLLGGGQGRLQLLVVAAGRRGRGAQVGEALEQHVEQGGRHRSEEHTSELQSRENLVCRLLLEKKKKK